MLFNSHIFIFLFLPLTLIGFYLIKRANARAAKVWLIGMSLWFYGYFNTGYLAIMIVSVLFNYAIYVLMKRTGKPAALKVTLTVGIIGNLALLMYFKYTDFLIDSCNRIFTLNIPLKNILLPLGISFFTFHQIGFLADAYSGEVKECGFVDYALFVTFFPQLIAGPIADNKSMMPQYEGIKKGKDFDTEVFCKGAMLFILGLCKKVLLADTFGKSVDYAYTNLSYGINSIEALLAILFYTLQLYFDFSGYCDMALGIGMMFGIDIPVNFDSPYKSRNIGEFWRRWHITLNRFLTDNIYIPLGGSRKGEVRTYINIFLVFLISGIWHGAGVTFIIWGLMHGIMSIITRLIRTKFRIELNGVISHIITFVFVCLAWVFFRADTVSQALDMIKSAFAGTFMRPGEDFMSGFNSGEFWYVLKICHLTTLSFGRYILMIAFTLAGTVMVFFLPNARQIAGKARLNIINGIIFGALLAWCIISLSGVSTFLYFNF
jgi:D-alanyl-lipoteichoic acid acyltransferase DltB (MBOAT superfamily)